jgi:membrane protein YqaA with SNARE-associated domain
MDPRELCLEYGWYLSTIIYGCVSGLVPVFNCELYLLYLAVKAPRAELPLLVLIITLGQMAAKCILYWGGRGALRIPAALEGGTVALLSQRLGSGWKGAAVIFGSALSGLPPFYPMSVACGVLRWSFVSFLVFGTAGRFLRFAAVMLVPLGLGSEWLPSPTVVGAIAVGGTAVLALASYAPRWLASRA